MSKQTAVKWLIDEIEKHYMINNARLDPAIIMELEKQANAMFEEQIMDAHTHGFTEGVLLSATSKLTTSKTYYNKTFKGNK